MTAFRTFTGGLLLVVSACGGRAPTSPSNDNPFGLTNGPSTRHAV